jgi:hypothetical protein
MRWWTVTSTPSDRLRAGEATEEKREEARETLPEEVRAVFDELVVDYQGFAMKHDKGAWVSYLVLADPKVFLKPLNARAQPRARPISLSSARWLQRAVRLLALHCEHGTRSRT